MVQVRPFRFTGLRRFTRDQIVVQESLAEHLTRHPLDASFLPSLGSLLERYLKVPCRFSDPELRPVNKNEMATLLPALSCLLVIGAAPSEHKIIVDLDAGVAALAIDRLLGGHGEEARILRPLTEIEEGVLSFLVLQVLAQVHSGWETGRELGLTLDRFAARPSDLHPLIEAVSGYFMLGIRMAVGRHVGYARVFLPLGLMTKTFGAVPAQSGSSPNEHELMKKLLLSIGDVALTARVEIAQLDLGPADIANLEVGDIIILENHRLTKAPNGFEGQVFVKLGAGMNGGVKGRLFSEDNQSRLEIVEIVTQEKPAEVIMPQPEGAATPEAPEAKAEQQGDNFAQTEGLLRDVDAPVVVELGRIRLNTSQVIRLRAGQILRLPRGPTDPVDLVVNGKLFARGELIEVDGELGVRLLQVTAQR
jgi:type III secretion protein Q